MSEFYSCKELNNGPGGEIRPDFVPDFAPVVPAQGRRSSGSPLGGQGLEARAPPRRPRVPALGPTPPRRPRRPSTPLRAAPARRGSREPRHEGRCSAWAGRRRQAAGGVPFKSRETPRHGAAAAAAAAAPVLSPPRSAAPGLRCARRSASHTPPGIGSLRRTPAAAGSAAHRNDLGASASRITGGSESARPCAPLRRGLGCPGRARAEDRRAERWGAGSRAQAPRCRSPPAGARGPETRRPRCDRTPGWPQRAQRLGPRARRARGEHSHPPRRPGTRLDSPKNAPEDDGAPDPRWFQLASANGGALEEGRVMRGGSSPGPEIAAAPFPGPGVAQDGWPEPWAAAELAPSARPSTPESRSRPHAGPRVPRALVPKDNDSTSFSFLPSLSCPALLPLLAVVVCQHLAGDVLNLQGE
nr:serine/arginine repetitive matrix protein 3-like [Camelus dromedarius]